ncbi:MAG: hypothetical protein M3460_01940 [Actinomycetota bacterium]|nr:hypothetical protein [Actinomycetota bacterium]
MEQIQGGAHPEDVAESLEMDRSTVFAWVAKFRAGGIEHCARSRCQVARPNLSGAQLR